MIIYTNSIKLPLESLGLYILDQPAEWFLFYQDRYTERLILTITLQPEVELSDYLHLKVIT